MVKRSLIALALMWAVLLLAPPFAPQTQRMRAPLGENGLWPYQSKPGLQELARLTRQQPDDPLLAYWNVRSQYRSGNALYWQKLDALVARYPANLALRRAKLVAANNLELVRQTETPRRLQFSRPGGAQEQYKPQQRATVIEQARLGARQAPADGFFAWMEALALWNSDEEPALRALERAAKTSDFNDGIMDNQRALLNWQEKQHPLQWDEKLATVYAELFPHYSQIKILHNEVVWIGIARYRSGDKAGAYRRWKIALEAAGALRRAHNRGPQAILLGVLIGESLQTEVWNTVAQELNKPADFDKNSAPKNWQLGAFQALARRDGQGALAGSAAREYASFQSEKINASGTMNPYESALGLSATSTRLSLQTPWLGRNVFWLSVAGALCLLVCPVWRRFFRDARGEVSAGQIAFFGALWTGALALAAWGRIGPEIQVFYSLSGGDSAAIVSWPSLIEIFDEATYFWMAITGTLLGSIGLCYWQKAREDGRLRAQLLRARKRTWRSSSLWPILTGGVWLLVLLVASLNLNAANRSDGALLQLSWGALTALALVLTIVQSERNAVLDKRRSRLAIASATCALVAFGLGAFFDVSEAVALFFVAALLMLCALGTLLYLGLTATGWRPSFARYLGVALQTLGGVAVICTVTLLVASLAALPVRARQNRIIDDYIARGEVDWMRAQPSIRNASAKTSP